MKISVSLLLALLCISNAFAQTSVQPKGAQFSFINNERIHYFGLVEINGNVFYQFQFKNSGDSPLVITEMHSSSKDISHASCKVALKYPAKPVMPGRKGTITVSITAGDQTGSFKDEIYVTSNATDSNYALLLVLGAVMPSHGKYKDPDPDLTGYFQFLTPVIRANTN